MLVARSVIKTRSYPTNEQVDVLRRFGVNVGQNTRRTYFTARLTHEDAARLKAYPFVQSVHEDVEGTHCDS